MGVMSVLQYLIRVNILTTNTSKEIKMMKKQYQVGEQLEKIQENK